MRRIALFVATLSLTPLASAASPPHLYEVDVLVFANHLRKLDGHEQWSAEKISPIKGFHKALTPSRGLPAGSQLAVAESILARHPHYTILAARSWVQNAVSLRKTKPIRITSRAHGRLKGVVRVFQWRLLHVALDLHYTPAATSTLSSASGPYELQESRPIAIRRTNYFDQPKFGVLVRVVPYQGSVPAQP